ncbi:MAG TPA: hypothetical protein EYH27_07645, partial [Anaerolineales bacterium]|nr:hypothetical protein [Anaerolineales bacterium]
ESVNMAYMMELPMLIVLVQRMGPSTGTATAGAQGDLLLLRGVISGGYPLPVLCIADLEDCWHLPPVALRLAVEARTPVVLLTSKEMVMTQRGFDLDRLEGIEPVKRTFYEGPGPYRPYAAADSRVPPFLPVGNDAHRVRITASTHDTHGILRHATGEALANTMRLPEKVEAHTPILYELDEHEEAETLVVAYGITAGAAREAVAALRARGTPVSLLIPRTLLPIPPTYYALLDRYRRVVIAEENMEGQFARLLFGHRLPEKVRPVTGIGRMIPPDRIAQEVEAR